MSKPTLTAAERSAIEYAIDNLEASRSVDCDDPQCGDSTWDHDCNAGYEDIPEAVEAIKTLEAMLGKTTEPNTDE